MLFFLFDEWCSNLSIAIFAGREYDALNSSERPSQQHNIKERCKMDDNDMRAFYKTEIDKLIDQTNDDNVLDLVYKILLLEV